MPVLGATRANLSMACKAFVTKPISLWHAMGADWVCLNQQVADVVVLLWVFGFGFVCVCVCVFFFTSLVVLVVVVSHGCWL